MNKPMTSRLTSKGQATIPVEIRKVLHLREGDRVVFELRNKKVTVRRADPEDLMFLKQAETIFDDWNHPEAEAAFRDL